MVYCFYFFGGGCNPGLSISQLMWHFSSKGPIYVLDYTSAQALIMKIQKRG